jgi:photosystem II stability/assembly factor-like uncharacterized protein
MEPQWSISDVVAEPDFFYVKPAARVAGLVVTASLIPAYSWGSVWRATGPYGGDAELVRTSPAAKNFVLAGSRNGLIFISDNGGASWNNQPFPAQFAGVLHALEVDPHSAGTWYAGVESESSWLSGVYKTTDAGKKWTLLDGTRGLAIWSLALYPGDSSRLAAGTGTGVYLSADAGGTWKHISRDGDAELRPVVSLAFHPSNPQTIFAGTTHLPWRTADGGNSWESIHEGMIDDSDVFSIQVDPAQPLRVFASACSGVYASTNGANKWAKLDTPPGTFRTYFVAIDPKHPEVVFAGTTGGLLRSANGGHAWRKVSAEAVKSIAFDTTVENRIFFASTTAGLLVSGDGGMNVHESNTGFANRSFTSLTGAGIDLYSTSVYEAGAGGVYRTENLGLRWAHTGVPSGDQLLSVAVSTEDTKVLYGAGYHSFVSSKDGGVTWTPIRSGPSSRVTSILSLPHGSLVVGAEDGLYTGTATGTWRRVAESRIVSLNSSGNLIFALTPTGALASADSGATWTTCGQPSGSAAWYGITFDSGSPSTALAATSAGLFRSTDGCRSWTAVNGGLRTETVSIVLFHPARAGEAYLAQGGMVFRSTDGGQQWWPLDEEAPGNSGPSSLFVLPAAPDRLFALFPRRGIFSTSIAISTKERTLQ